MLRMTHSLNSNQLACTICFLQPRILLSFVKPSWSFKASDSCGIDALILDVNLNSNEGQLWLRSAAQWSRVRASPATNGEKPMDAPRCAPVTRWTGTSTCERC